MLLQASLALALAVPTFTALAANVIDDGAPFPSRAKTAPTATAKAANATKATPAKAAALPASTPAPTLSDRALSLASGLNRLLSPISLAPAAEDLPAEAVGEPLQGDSENRVKTVLQKALAMLGTPYRWGGEDPAKGFDCSGLVGYVFRSALGIELPRVSRDMAKSGELVTDRAQLSAGDLVFFGLKGRVNHVGIYLGDGRFVHAPRRGRDVTVSSLDEGYWRGRFMQARRVDTADSH